jgi:hypothetical protein
MKLLIAISSCERDRTTGVNDAVRATWGADVAGTNTAEHAVDYKFFIGGSTVVDADEVSLDVPDDYLSLTYKTQAAHQWAIVHGYSHIFQTFTDVYVRPERLLAAAVEYTPEKEYVGFVLVDPTTNQPYASGGAGYMLTARASAFMQDADPLEDWAEDRWTGIVMRRNGVGLFNDHRYGPKVRPILARNTQITSHLSRATGKYEPQWMKNTHKMYLLSQED